MTCHCVFVGAGHGAAQLCASLVAGKWNGSITLIGDEDTLPYHRPPLSKTQLDPDGEQEVKLIRPESFYSSNQIEWISEARVMEINRNEKWVKTENQTIPYDKLVLSTGSIHNLPPIPGINHPLVFGLRTASEAAALRDRIRDSSKAVILGAGFIGLEVAASLRSLGLEVTVLELAPRVLNRVTSPEISTFFENLHKDHGVDLRTAVSGQEISPSDKGLTVRTSCGDEISCDFVVLGTGAQANTALADSAGLKVNNGIQVDEYNITSDSDIYALGDCCSQFSTRYNRWMRLESVQNALDQGKTVAHTLSGNPLPHSALPWFWSDQFDVKLQIVGISTGYDAVIIRGVPKKGTPFSAWYFKGPRLLAVDAVNDASAYALGTKLLRANRHPEPSTLEDESISPAEILTQAKEI